MDIQRQKKQAKIWKKEFIEQALVLQTDEGRRQLVRLSIA